MKSVLCRPVHVLLEGGFSNFSERLKAAALRLPAVRLGGPFHLLCNSVLMEVFVFVGDFTCYVTHFLSYYD